MSASIYISAFQTAEKQEVLQKYFEGQSQVYHILYMQSPIFWVHQFSQVLTLYSSSLSTAVVNDVIQTSKNLELPHTKSYKVSMKLSVAY